MKSPLQETQAKAESKASHKVKKERKEEEDSPYGTDIKQRTASPAPSLKSNKSKDKPPDFSNEPRPSDSDEDPCCQHSPTENTEYQTQTTVQDEHKIRLRSQYGSVVEGTVGASCRPSLNSIYTPLYITEGQYQDPDTQNELSELSHECLVECQNIFKVLPKDEKPVRVVLTNGVAGIGKTFLVLKFTVDWAEGSENQDVDLVVPLSFRELNLVRGGRYSLLELIHMFHPSLQKLSAETLAHSKVLFIFDGLDESRLPLDFESCECVSELTQRSQLSVLLVNLIKGNLLPSALIWITSRPAATNHIPDSCVDRVTVVMGFFTDEQKEEYFRKRFKDEELSTKIISHVKTSKTLHNMCQIPVFCWIIATVLDDMLKTKQTEELPQTLTDLYAHFLLLQTHRKRLTSKHGEDRALLLKLGRLAFEQLEKGNIMFYQEDLEQAGLSVTEAVVYGGVCTEVLKRDSVIVNTPIYCFLHLSVQEFLAGVYMFHLYMCSEAVQWIMGDGDHNATLDIFLQKAMRNSLRSKNGHLDMVVRFLHGISMESNLKLLKDLLGPVQIQPEVRQKVLENLKKMNTEEASAKKRINIIYCLLEMKDHSLHQEIQEILKSQELTCIESAALAFMLRMMGDRMNEQIKKKGY